MPRRYDSDSDSSSDSSSSDYSPRQRRRSYKYDKHDKSEDRYSSDDDKYSSDDDKRDRKHDRKYDGKHIDRELGRKLLHLWKCLYPKADFLRRDLDGRKGVVVITHPSGHQMKVNGVKVVGPLFESGLAQYSLADDHWANYYENPMLIDIPGKHGHDSTTKVYVRELGKQDLPEDADHYHVKGAKVGLGETGIFAIHHLDQHLHPLEYTKRTLKALKEYEDALHKYAHDSDHDH